MDVDDQSVSVIIVNYNSGDILLQCVKSILDNESVLEVIVVDNASTDESLTLPESLYLSETRLTILRNQKNKGFAAACNRGASIATGQNLLYLNPDCVVEKATISELTDILKQNSSAGMAGGLLLYPDGTEQPGGRRRVPTPWRTLVRVLGLSRLADRYPRLFTDFNLHLQPLPEQPIEVEATSGACMLVRREALEDVGGLDEGYFLHCEDLDWCMRFRQLGWKILFVPSARLIHYVGHCGRNRPVFVEWHKHRGMIRFYRKFFRHQYPGILMWMVIVGVWTRFGLVSCYHTLRKLSRDSGQVNE